MADRARTAPLDESVVRSKEHERMRDNAQDDGGPVDMSTVADEMKTIASELKSVAGEQGRQFFAGAKEQAAGFADRHKDEAAQSVADIAVGLRETGRSFADRPNIRAFVESAADGLEQLAGGLRERSFADLYGEAESFARRSPAVVGAAALAAGFLLARFIKSSADDLSDVSAARRAAAPRGTRPARPAVDA